MTKYSFMNDYSEGCHPDILAAVTESHLKQQAGYSNDSHSDLARELIRQEIGRANAEVFYVPGGTLANLLVAASCLRSHEAVISASTGHIALREAGAIEAVGHKIITVPSEDGKLTPDGVRLAFEQNSGAPNFAKPRLVYISNATELGTVYTKAELTALSDLCRALGLLLFLDGARLGPALSAQKNDLSLKDVAELTDIFWIGGTKVGALLGEAIVISEPELAEDFLYHIKQRGGLLAKGWLMGIQFAELFKSGLFFDLSKHSNAMAGKLAAGVRAAGSTFRAEPEANMLFPILPDRVIANLQEAFQFYVWEKDSDDHSVVRLVTSWATPEEQVDAFVKRLQHAAAE